MRVFPVILSMLLLGGCATYDALFSRGAQFYDQMLQGAVDIKCRAVSAGAIQRRYMQTPETWKQWTDECLLNGGESIPEVGRGEE